MRRGHVSEPHGGQPARRTRRVLARLLAGRLQPPCLASHWRGLGPVPASPWGVQGAWPTVHGAGTRPGLALGLEALSKVLKTLCSSLREFRVALRNTSSTGPNFNTSELWFCLHISGNVSLFINLGQTLSRPATFLDPIPPSLPLSSLPPPLPSSLFTAIPQRTEKDTLPLLGPLRK